MTPIFTTHGSIGSSILTYNKPKDIADTLSSDSIFDIWQEGLLDQLVVVESTFLSYRKINQYCLSKNIPLVFGIKFECVQTSLDESKHKIIIFAKNSQGIRNLRKIYSDSYINNEGDNLGVIKLDEVCNVSDIVFAIPFYDSFLFKNSLYFDTALFEVNKIKPMMFIEENEHPFDMLMAPIVKEFAANNSLELKPVKSILYKEKKDFYAYQAYKAICGRNGYSGKKASAGNPNLEHCCSAEFCWESWKIKTSLSN